MTELPPFLSETVAPDRNASVLRQTVSFNPRTWKRWLSPELWPAELELLPIVGRFHQIDREDVFRLSTAVGTPAGAVRSYVATCVWGTGTAGVGVARRARPLLAHDDAGERLLKAIETLRVDGAVAAYERLQKGGDAHLTGLGPGFFTKVLYFAGWGAPAGPRPLILDRYVVLALNEQAGFNWRMNWNWTADQYARYLETAANWADAWGTTADVVERALFDHGKTLARPDNPSRTMANEA